LLLALTALSSFAACSNMEVNTAQAPDTNFAQYKTYAWAQTTENVGTQEGSILDQTIKSTLQDQLASKGLSPAEGSTPDILISYTAKAREGVEYGVAPGPWGWDETTAYPVREGSIRLQFIDAKTGKAIWQGTASDVVGNNGASQKQVADAVKDLVKKYPTS